MNEKLWDKAVEFHGHVCPGLAIGFRACEIAKNKMEIGISDDEEIVCITENDACGVDAVQVIFSCTVGKGNLLHRNTGKQAFSFFNRKTGEKLRLYLKAQNNTGMDRESWRKYILEAPEEDVFSVSQPMYDLPEKARLFKTMYCEICGEGAPDHKMRLQEDQVVCLDCFKEYKRGW
ncbi:TraR/DksA C4-type zinc finger protein [Alkalibacter rhizosphaerae]|uniref:TraR/DksA C4-type zinc finger protein n=1 Tax=Alkalibacter rhizosphaerae TaxID=2815577 RepID=A0A974XFK4_9FIRM|nr:FmdE family protein [Alkalibacter rhizosphaerae]QSX08796.1 TraR/DksA C4-type zinc finger protein [Alkalibacter rhizosphaerae]